MSESFDPYHKWLGVSPKDQPPNHYRLLGIDLFEDDADVIADAAEQRMVHVRTYQLGPYSELSQEILNELAAAKVCLLKPAKKLAYDAELRAALGAGGQDLPAQPVGHMPPVALEKLDFPAPARAPAVPPLLDTFSEMAAPSGTIRARQGRGKKKRRQKHSAMLIVQFILTGVIGLAAGCFILFLVNPQHPLIVSLYRFFHPPQVALHKDHNQPVPKVLPRKRSSPERRKLPPAQEHQQREEKEPSSREQIPSTPKEGDARQEAPSDEVTAPLTQVPKTIVLDLTRPAMYVKLPEVTNGDKVQIQVEDVASLGTSYDLKPSQGVIELRQPVYVVLTEYAGVTIRLSLLKRGGNAVLNVATEIDIGRNEPIEFTQQRVKMAYADLMKDAGYLNQQLSAARTEAVTIENWLKSPVPKPAPLRGQQVQRLLTLQKQIIPALEQQMGYAQNRVEVLQRLFQLAEQIHGTAEIRYVVQPGSTGS